MGTGSNRHIVGLDEVIRLFSSSCPKLQVQLCAYRSMQVLSTFTLFRKKVIPVYNNMLSWVEGCNDTHNEGDPWKSF